MREGAGWLEERGGRLVLHTRGSPYDEGYQHGALLREPVRACFREVWRGGWLIGSPLLPPWLWHAYARRNERYLTADERRELQGLADGAGLPYRDVLLMNSQPLADLVFHWLTGGCTQLVATAPATPDGHVRVARNLDTVGFERLHRYAVIQVHHPDRGFAFLTPGFAGKVLDSVTGWNERGLHVCQDDAEWRWQSPFGLYSGALVRRLAQHCADVSAAEAAVRRLRRLSAAAKSVTLVDPHQARVLEIRQSPLPGMPAVASRAPGETGDPPGTILLTNHHRAIPAQASRSSRRRLERLRALAAAPIDDAAAMAILTDKLDLETGRESRESDCIINWRGPRLTRFGPFPVPAALTVRIATTVSTVSDLTAGRMWVADGRSWIHDPSQFAPLNVPAELARRSP